MHCNRLKGIINFKLNDDGTHVNETHIARVTPGDESCATMKVPHDETKFALMANLFVSEGQSGKVCMSFSSRLFYSLINVNR